MLGWVSLSSLVAPYGDSGPINPRVGECEVIPVARAKTRRMGPQERDL